MAISDGVIEAGVKAINRVHGTLARVSGGRLMNSAMGLPTVELHTVGRKSGLPRSCYLMAPILDADRAVIVASKVGHERNPDWYANLRARPDAEMVIRGVRRRIHARTATPQEKAQLWPTIVAGYRGYATYQKRTARDIPVVICELGDVIAG